MPRLTSEFLLCAMLFYWAKIRTAGRKVLLEILANSVLRILVFNVSRSVAFFSENRFNDSGKVSKRERFGNERHALSGLLFSPDVIT
jgi:hypothetical protein